MKNIILISTVLSSLIYASGPVYKTGFIWSYYPGDDDFYESGLEANFKSLDANNDVILDTRLNLYWQNDHKNNGTDDTWADYNHTVAKDYCNGVSLLGKTWRLPTRLEAKTIFFLKYGESKNVVEIFKDTVTYDSSENVDGNLFNVTKFWTATENADKAWVADFYNGADRATELKSETHNVRCVSGANSIKSDYSRIEVDEIVVDNSTHLMWQDSQSLEKRTWENSIDYCEALEMSEYKDWRVPNFIELYFLTDATNNPAIDTIFKNTADDFYWSSTSTPSYSNYKLVITASSGADTGKEKSTKGSVRCVREMKNSSLPAIINYLLN